MTNLEAFVFFLGGLIVGLCAWPIVQELSQFSEPPFQQGEDRWGGEE